MLWWWSSLGLEGLLPEEGLLVGGFGEGVGLC